MKAVESCVVVRARRGQIHVLRENKVLMGCRWNVLSLQPGALLL